MRFKAEMLYWFAACALAAAHFLVLSAAAQQLPSPWTALPHPTDAGKPVIFDPQYLAKSESDRLSGCTPPLQCRLQLLGVIQNNGSVELQATALKW
jgi:hypothetical protein